MMTGKKTASLSMLSLHSSTACAFYWHKVVNYINNWIYKICSVHGQNFFMNDIISSPWFCLQLISVNLTLYNRRASEINSAWFLPLLARSNVHWCFYDMRLYMFFFDAGLQLLFLGVFTYFANWILHNPMCTAMFRCGCLLPPPLGVGWMHCNVHNKTGKNGNRGGTTSTAGGVASLAWLVTAITLAHL